MEGGRKGKEWKEKGNGRNGGKKGKGREYFQLGKEIKLKNVRVGNKIKVSGNFIHPCVYYKCS